jgi:hypothetical protein
MSSYSLAGKAYHLLSSHKKKEQKSGEKYHKLAGKINPFYMITFILALIFILITTILNMRTL